MRRRTARPTERTRRTRGLFSHFAPLLTLALLALGAFSTSAQAQALPDCDPLPAGSGVEREVVFLVDGSGSIDVDDWALERNALIQLLDDPTRVPLDGSLAVAVIQYSTEADSTPLTRVQQCLKQLTGPLDLTIVKSEVSRMSKIGRGTAEGAAIEDGAAHLSLLGDPQASEQRLCVLTDGRANSGPSAFEAANTAASLGVDRLSITAFQDRTVFGLAEAEDAFLAAVFGSGQLTFATNTPEFAVLAGDNCLGDPVRLRAFEVNQSVQDWSDSVALVEDKTTFVRAFIEPEVCPSTDVESTSARLHAWRDGVVLGDPVLPTNTSTRTSFDCSTVSRRDQPAATLNFRLPNDWLSGDVVLELEVPGGIDCGAGVAVDRCQKEVSFEPLAFPAVTWVSMPSKKAYDPTKPPTQSRPVRTPLGSELIEQNQRSQAMLPVAEVDATYEYFGSVIDEGIWEQDPTDMSWSIKRIDSLVLRDLEWYFWKNLCSSGLEGCPTDRVHGVVNRIAGVVGMANSLGLGLPVSVSNMGQAAGRNVSGHYRHHATHELTHNFDVPHTTNKSLFGTDADGFVLGPCGAVASEEFNPEYPDVTFFASLESLVPPLDSGWRASLGPLLLPPGTNSVAEVWATDAHTYQWELFPDLALGNPAEDWALMSYCSRPISPNSQKWISKTNYTRVADYLRATDFDALLPPGQVDIEESWVSRGFFDELTDAFEFAPMYQAPGPGSLAPAPGDFTFELLDASGAVLESASFQPTAPEPYIPDPDATDEPVTPPDERLSFFLALPAPATPVAEVVVRRGATELARLPASPSAPTLSIVEPAAASVLSEDMVRFAWTADDADGDTLHHAVDYSHDGGTTWVALAVDLSEPELELERSWLRAGPAARFRVTTTDGMRSVTAVSDAFEVVNNKPLVVMQSPEPDQAFYSSQTIPLYATAFDREDGPLGGASVEWISSRNGPLGFGAKLDVGAHTLTAGRHLIVARAVDSAGNPGSGWAEIDIERLPPADASLPDFSLRLDPPSRAINPGDSTEFTVYVSSLNGFASPVTLSAVDLPAGWTTSFSPRTVTPDGSSKLTVWAADDAAEESVPLVVQGVSGDLVHVTSGTAGVLFGLIPQCYGRFAGFVYDAYTEQPLEGVQVGYPSFGAVSDATGYFESTDIAPRDQYIQTAFTGYYTVTRTSVPVRCEDVTNLDIPMVPVLKGTATGRVVVGIPDPDDTSAGRAVTATTTGVPGATVSMSVFTSADDEGFYTLGGIGLGGNNAPKLYNAQASATGFWLQRKLVTIEPDSIANLDFELVERCDFEVEATGTAFWDDGRPATGAKIRFASSTTPSGSRPTATVDAAGQFQIPRDVITPEYNNSEIEATLYVESPPLEIALGYSVQNVQIADQCGLNELAGYEVTLIARPPPPQENLARVSGTIRDARTLEPLPSISVYVRRQNGSQISNRLRTDENGFYESDITVGFDDDTSETVYVDARFSNDHWDGRSVDFVLNAGDDVTVDVLKEPIDFVTVEGVVRDRETRQPVPGAQIRVQTLGPSSDQTDENGFYRLERIYPGRQNTPDTIAITMGSQSPAGSGAWYYYEQALRFIEPGDALYQDLDPLRRCSGGAVSGVVVNAETLEPLEGALVREWAGSNDDLTDVDGRFRLEGIIPSNGNTPRQAEIRASKSGFITASKTVTIFCGAEIFLEFGTPQGGFGEIFGTITDEQTGDPLEGVFVGTGWGGTTTTDALGQYTLENAPLATDGSDRVWRVTAKRGLDTLAADVTVSADAATQQDFAFPSDPELGLSVGDERTSFDPATRTLTSSSVLRVVNTTDSPVDGPVAATILIDRVGVDMPDAEGSDATGRPVFFVIGAGESLPPGETAEVDLVFTRQAPLAFLYDVQLVFGDPTTSEPSTPMAALGVIPASADSDGDRWHDALDVCPTRPDPLQSDADGDGVGDACAAQARPDDVRAPSAMAEWIRLTGTAPEGAESVSLGEVSELVDASGRFEIAAPILGTDADPLLVFTGPTGIVATRTLTIEALDASAAEGSAAPGEE